MAGSTADIAHLNPQVTPAAAILQAINVARELHSGTGDAAYLDAVGSALHEAFSQFQPDLVLYNAGTDILQGGQLMGRPPRWPTSLGLLASLQTLWLMNIPSPLPQGTRWGA